MDNTKSIKDKKVFVAASGGVDSSTSAALLAQQGCDCTAVFMIVHDYAQQHCDDARAIAKHLGIKFHALDLREDFKTILDYFSGEYKHARTPNPCVLCNQLIKFGKLFDYARANGADFFATGHYVAIHSDTSGPALYTAANTAKDQSYALAMINRSVLPFLIFPLGSFDKTQTRQMAKEFGLPVSDKPDSQEICFIPDNDYAAKLCQLCPEVAKAGNIIDTTGKILGTHTGIHNFTIGQRRGAKVAMGIPWYVTKLDSTTNTVTLGPAEDLICKSLLASSPNWLIDAPSQPFAAKIKIRYNHKPVNGTVYPQQNSVKVEFDQPLRAVTPGQAVVYYLETPLGLKMAGGAWIEKALSE